MVKIDLVTGFLGSGKTTFLKKYISFLTEKGQRVGVLENDYGAVNVDMMLLDGPENCEVETIAGACDYDCHKRRFKTKLIAMGMSGFDRVIIEPSGIFELDEFFDTLREEPLDRWYEIGSVITIVDAADTSPLSDYARYIFAAQAANAGAIVFSKTQLCSEKQTEDKICAMNETLSAFGCDKQPPQAIITKSWDDLDSTDFEKISASGYRLCDYKKLPPDESGFDTVYLLEHSLTLKDTEPLLNKLFDKSCGDVFRVKGFVYDGRWYELNATEKQYRLEPIENGQEVIIVIGENLDEKLINKIIKPQR